MKRYTFENLQALISKSKSKLSYNFLIKSNFKIVSNLALCSYYKKTRHKRHSYPKHWFFHKSLIESEWRNFLCLRKIEWTTQKKNTRYINVVLRSTEIVIRRKEIYHTGSNITKKTHYRDARMSDLRIFQ